MVLDDFDRLPESSRQVHLISLLATALSTVLLMAPAAHQRIVEQGAKLRRSTAWLAATSAAVLLAASYGLWFGYTLYLRSQSSRDE